MAATAPWLFIFIVLYALVCLVVAVRAAFENTTAADFFIASRSLPGWVIALGLSATAYSGWVFLGHPGLIFRDGFQYAFAGFYAITIALTGVLFFKRQWVLSKRFGYVSAGELFSDYFQSRFVSLVSVVIALMFAIPFLGVEFTAAGHVVSVMAGGIVSPLVVTWVLAAFVVASVVAGGLRSVAYMSVMQAPLILIGIVLVGALALIFVGGLDALRDGLASLAAHPDLGKWGTNNAGHSAYFALPGAASLTAGLGREVPVNGLWTGLMCFTYLVSMMGIMASPAFSLWAFSARSPGGFAWQQVVLSGLLIGFALLVFTTVQGVAPHLLGANALAKEAGLTLANILPERLAREPDLLPVFFVDVLSDVAPWLFGVIAICILAAIQSTGSAHLHAAGTVCARDLAGASARRVVSSTNGIRIARLSMLAIVAAALVLPILSRDVMALAGGLAVASSAQLLPALFAVCWFPRLTRQGVHAGLVVGLSAVVVTDSAGLYLAALAGLELPFGKWPLNVHSACWGLLFNTVIAVGVSALSQDVGELRHRMRFHNFLNEYAPLRSDQGTVGIVTWVLVVLFAVFGIGPLAVLGNTIFGEPATGPDGWLFGIPSLWAWQLGWWIAGVVILWLLAYRLRFSTSPHRRVDALVDDVADVLARSSR